MDAVNRIGQVWMAQIGVERFPFVVIEKRTSTCWLVQNLLRVELGDGNGTIRASQFGVEEGCSSISRGKRPNRKG